MTDWKERFIEKALTEENDLLLKLHTLALLDTQVTAPTQTISIGGRIGRGIDNREQARLMQEPGWLDKKQRLEELCDEVAAMVFEPGENVEEIASWISYNCQEVEEEIRDRLHRSFAYHYEMPKQMLRWAVIAFASGVGVFFYVSRVWGFVWWQSLLLATALTVLMFYGLMRLWTISKGL